MTSLTGEQSTCPNPANSDDPVGEYLAKFKRVVDDACEPRDKGADMTKIRARQLEKLKALETTASETREGQHVLEKLGSRFGGEPLSSFITNYNNKPANRPSEEQKAMQEHSRQPTSSFTSTAGASPQDVPLDQKAPSQAESSDTAMEGKPMRTDSSGTQTEQPGDPDGEDGGVGTSKRTTDAKVAQSGDFRGFRKGFWS